VNSVRWSQHSIGYLEDSFTGQKTQPTVSKYWREKRYKTKKEKVNNTKYTKTKLAWFSRLIWHSARKRGGLSLQRCWAHTGPCALHSTEYQWRSVMILYNTDGLVSLNHPRQTTRNPVLQLTYWLTFLYDLECLYTATYIIQFTVNNKNHEADVQTITSENKETSASGSYCGIFTLCTTNECILLQICQIFTSGPFAILWIWKSSHSKCTVYVIIFIEWYIAYGKKL